jgi:hypothetical protein
MGAERDIQRGPSWQLTVAYGSRSARSGSTPGRAIRSYVASIGAAF